jgi:hypothetical protein
MNADPFTTAYFAQASAQDFIWAKEDARTAQTARTETQRKHYLERARRNLARALLNRKRGS